MGVAPWGALIGYPLITSDITWPVCFSHQPPATTKITINFPIEIQYTYLENTLEHAKVLEILLDKGLLVIIAAVFGYVLSRMLERFKRDQAILQNIGIKRAESVFLVLAQASRLNGAALGAIKREDKNEIDRIIAEANLLVDLMHEHRYLLGNYYTLCQHYMEIQVDLIHAWACSKSDEFNTFTDQLITLSREMDRMLIVGPSAKFSWRTRWLLLRLKYSKVAPNQSLQR